MLNILKQKVSDNINKKFLFLEVGFSMDFALYVDELEKKEIEQQKEILKLKKEIKSLKEKQDEKNTNS